MKIFKKIVKLTLLLFGVLCLIQLFFFWQATTSPQWQYARKTFSTRSANFDLRYCIDLPADSRKDFTNNSWKPMPCINTATSFYNYTHRAGNCNKFMQNPAQWNFVEISDNEAVPGDLMLFIRKKDGARHAGIYTMNSLVGPLCANTLTKGIFVHFLPIKPLLAMQFIGFYKVKYYRYIGE